MVDHTERALELHAAHLEFVQAVVHQRARQQTLAEADRGHGLQGLEIFGGEAGLDVRSERREGLLEDFARGGQARGRRGGGARGGGRGGGPRGGGRGGGAAGEAER